MWGAVGLLGRQLGALSGAHFALESRPSVAKNNSSENDDPTSGFHVRRQPRPRTNNELALERDSGPFHAFRRLGPIHLIPSANSIRAKAAGHLLLPPTLAARLGVAAKLEWPAGGHFAFAGVNFHHLLPEAAKAAKANFARTGSGASGLLLLLEAARLRDDQRQRADSPAQICAPRSGRRPPEEQSAVGIVGRPPRRPLWCRGGRLKVTSDVGAFQRLLLHRLQLGPSGADARKLAWADKWRRDEHGQGEQIESAAKMLAWRRQRDKELTPWPLYLHLPGAVPAQAKWAELAGPCKLGMQSGMQTRWRAGQRADGSVLK